MSCHGTVRGKDGGDTEPQHHLHGTTTDSRSGLANPWHEEPDARIAHVRICGSRGRATALGHPAKRFLAWASFLFSGDSPAPDRVRAGQVCPAPPGLRQR